MKRFSTFCFCLLCALCVTVMLSEAATTFRNHINAPKGSTTLAAGITSGETTVVVATGGGALLPAAPFAITIDNEILAVSQKVNDTLTVSRGFDNSTASAHNIGANVYNYVIADDFVDIHTAINGIESGTTTLASVSATGTVQTLGAMIAGTNITASGAVTGGTGVTASTGNITATTGDIIAGDDMQCDRLTANSISVSEGEGITLQGTISTTEIIPPEGQDTLALGAADDQIRVTNDLKVDNELLVGTAGVEVDGYDITTGSTFSPIVYTSTLYSPGIISPVDVELLNFFTPATYEGEMVLTKHDAQANVYGYITVIDETGSELAGSVNADAFNLGTYGEGEKTVSLAMDETEGEPVGRAELKAASVLITTPDAEGECDVVVDGDLDADVITASECAPDVLTLGQTSLQQLPEGALDDYINVNANGMVSSEGEFYIGNPVAQVGLIGASGVGIASDTVVYVGPISEGEVPFSVTGKASALSAEWGAEGDTTEFTANGFQKMSGAAQAWDDLRIEPVARATGTNTPAFEKYYDDSGNTSRGVYLYSFDDAITASEKELHFTMQLPHSWNQDDIYIHVHWVPSTADTSATPRWGLEYAWAEPGSNFSDSTIIYATGNHLSEADLTANRHYITSFAALSPTTSQDGLSSVLIGRLFRNSGDAADTYDVGGNKCGLLYIDAHFQLNSLGSSSELGGKGE